MTSDVAPWRDGTHPTTVPCHALLQPDEIAYASWLAASPRVAGSTIIDLGAYLGGSSHALARGSAVHGAAAPRLIAYDTFRVWKPGSRPDAGESAFGESYADLYRANLAEYLDRVTLREGEVPPWLDPETAARTLYPEGDPVSILFIDCAKRWGVHHTILGAFGPCLREGSVIVQQDFRSVLVYLPLHMYQLRDVLTPAHSCDGGSFGFLARGPITREAVASLWTPGDVAAHGFDRTVAAAARWFDDHAPEPLGPWVWLAAAGDRADAGNGVHALACFDRAMAGVSSLARTMTDPSRWASQRELWTGEVRKLAVVLRRRGLEADANAVERCSVWGAESEQTRSYETSDLLLRWRGVAAECRERGWTRLALYGAGRHTQKLLAAGFPEDEAVRVVAVIDDNAARTGGSIRGIPVVGPEALPAAVDAILPSSDANEAALLPRCGRLAETLGVGTLRVYVA